MTCKGFLCQHEYFAWPKTETQEIIEKEACRRYATDKATALRQLNDYSNLQAQRMLARWTQLAFHLIVKYNDMVVRPTDENGNFLRTKRGTPAPVWRSGYPAPYARKLAKELTPMP